jgi:hypothetical protein
MVRGVGHIFPMRGSSFEHRVVNFEREAEREEFDGESVSGLDSVQNAGRRARATIVVCAVLVDI